MLLDPSPMILAANLPRCGVNLRFDIDERIRPVSIDQCFGFGAISRMLLAISTELKQHWGGSAREYSPTLGCRYRNRCRASMFGLILRDDMLSRSAFYGSATATALDSNMHLVRTMTIDRIAIGVSGLCLVHCVATAALIATISTFGAVLGDPVIHEIGLAIAIFLGVIALGSGVIRHRRYLPSSIGALGLGAMAAALTLPHGAWEMAATMTGVVLLASGHILNRLALA